MTALLYIHGVGDNGTRRDWLEILHNRWGEGSPSRFDLVTPDFSDLLAEKSPVPQAPPIAKDLAAANPAHRRLYREAQALTHAQLLEAGSTPVWPYAPRGFGRVPGVLDAVAERIITTMLFEEVRRYASDPGLRQAIRSRVTEAILGQRSVVVLGHSLGALVALDLVQHLPPGVDVPLLVTAASPLARRNLPRDLRNLRKEFPYDRVHGWINVFNPSDAATRGRPIGLKFPAALDVCVAGDFQDHALATCVADAGVSAALGTALGVDVASTAIGGESKLTLADPDEPLSRPELLYLSTFQIGFRMEQMLLDRGDANPDEVSRFWEARRLASENSILRGTAGRQIWDTDHRDELHGRAAESDIPAVLVRLASVNPLGPLELAIPRSIEDQARRQVAIDIGLPPGWVDIAARSLHEATSALSHAGPAGDKEIPGGEPSGDDIIEAGHLTTSIHLSLAPLVPTEILPRSRFPSGVVDLRPLCIELAARARTAHRLGNPKAGVEERTALSRLMVILGQHRAQIMVKPGTHTHLSAEVRARMDTVGRALSWLAEQGVGLEPAR